MQQLKQHKKALQRQIMAAGSGKEIKKNVFGRRTEPSVILKSSRKEYCPPGRSVPEPYSNIVKRNSQSSLH